MTDQTPQSIAAHTYNAAADRFDAGPLSFWDRFGRRTVERLDLHAGARVLDVCCGSGASALPAAERVGPSGEVLGLDLADRLLELARAKAGQRRLTNARFAIADLETLAPDLGDFDAVVCVFGIFFVPDMARAVAGLWSHVRPGGSLAITTWGQHTFEPAGSAFWEAVHAEAPELYKAFNPWDRIDTPAGLAAVFQEAGVPSVDIAPESGTHLLTTAGDWWTIVLGSGFRGTVEKLDPAARERVRTQTLNRLQADGVKRIETNVLYAVARRPAGS
jgi:ubiquinone/menaquinone biosynthesis C-methylase UbiE